MTCSNLKLLEELASRLEEHPAVDTRKQIFGHATFKMMSRYDAQQRYISILKAELQAVCKEACLLEDDVNFAGSGYYNACSSHADDCKECKEEVELMDAAENEGNPMRAYRNSLIPPEALAKQNPNFDWRKAWKIRQSMKGEK